MKPRETKVLRETAEVKISVYLNLDGEGKTNVDTGIKFLDHMITTIAKHALFDLTVRAEGDLKHHVSEDVALAIGEALNQTLKDRRGIKRFGSAYVCMDDALARAVVDLGGRPYLKLDLQLNQPAVEDMKTEDLTHFFSSLTQTSKSNIHLAVLYGENSHHKVEAAVKSFAFAIKEAVSPEPRRTDVPSAKGVI
ncbi:MAG: imidazoleglycerol-phosphate dehydratase HisB [Candidatus Bathyarchaeia archaeon]